MSVTPIFGYTIPDADTEIENYPAVMAAGIADIENSRYIDGSVLTSTSSYTAYPVGVSLALIPTGSTGWPATAGLLMTMRQATPGSVIWQMFTFGAVTDHSQIYTRIGGATGWSSWSKIAGSGQPAGIQSGTASFVNNSSSASRTIGFTVGVFNGTPNVVATTHGGGYVASVSGITSTGCTISIDPNGGGTAMSGTADRFVDWIAIQNY